MVEKEVNKVYSWGNFFELLLSTKPSKRKLILGMIFNGISAILASILPINIQKIIDSFSSRGSIPFEHRYII